MNKALLWILIIIIIIGAIFLFTRNTANAPDDSNDEDGETVMNTVTYSDSGYSPSSLTVAAGETITFLNSSSQDMWTASALHPTHELYGGTPMSSHCPDPDNSSFDACQSTAPGESWTFTFNKVGSWKYHNHLRATHFGEVVVTE